MTLSPLWALLRDLGVFTAAGGLLVWLGRKLTTHLFSKDLEKFKSDLREQAAVRQIVYSKLHEDRAKIVAQLFSHLVEFEAAIESLTKPMQWAGELGLEEKARIAAEAGNTVLRYFEGNRIYFDEGLCRSIEELTKELRSVFIDATPPDEDPDHRIRREAWNQFKNRIPTLKASVEKEFRRLLGVALPGAT